jgi:hypothetical protein
MAKARKKKTSSRRAKASSRELGISELRGPFGDQLRQTLARYACPFIWYEDSSQAFVLGASCFFVDWGRGPFAITADHVYEGYLKTKAGYHLKCQLGNLAFDPQARLLDRKRPNSRDPDIATFRVSEKEVEEAGKIALTARAVIPQEGKGILFAGFPGIHRSLLGPGKLEIGISMGAGNCDHGHRPHFLFVRRKVLRRNRWLSRPTEGSRHGRTERRAGVITSQLTVRCDFLAASRSDDRVPGIPQAPLCRSSR